MKVRGPDHPIVIAHTGRPVHVLADGEEIACTADALTLIEAAYPPVQYLPREAADMARLERSSRVTY